jgi:hypothetical protein
MRMFVSYDEGLLIYLPTPGNWNKGVMTSWPNLSMIPAKCKSQRPLTQWSMTASGFY